MHYIRLEKFKNSTACKLKVFGKSVKANNPIIIRVWTWGFDKFGCMVKYLLRSIQVTQRGDSELYVEAQYYTRKYNSWKLYYNEPTCKFKKNIWWTKGSQKKHTI